MECKTFSVKVSVSYDDGGFRYWEDNPEEKAPDRWIAPNPYLTGRMLIVDGEAYGVLVDPISKEERLLRGVCLTNWVKMAPGIAFFVLPTNREKRIQAYLITDFDEPSHNRWTERGLFTWFTWKGKAKLEIEEMPYSVEQLRDEINKLSAVVNKVSKTNRMAMQRIDDLKLLFDNTVKLQDKSRY